MEKDQQLVTDIKIEVDRLLKEQNQPESSYYKDATGLSGELHGYLADLLYVDKAENQTLVDFIISLLYCKKRSHEEALLFFDELSVALGKLFTKV